MKDIRADLLEVIKQYSQVIVSEIERSYEGSTISGQGIAGFTNPEMVADQIMTIIFGAGQKAWILEYGRGSKMDKNNPHLGSYKYDNPLRTSETIVGRPAGEYPDLDGIEQISSGKKAGLPVESPRENSRWHPTEPQHIIEEAILGKDGHGGLLPEIMNSLADVILNYPFEDLFPKTIVL